jgi:phosphoserine aminotransferase
MSSRVFNFYAGPTSLPLPVLARMQRELLNFQGTGMSIMEISHRAREIEDMLADTRERTRRLLCLDDDFEVLLLQGGGSLEFCMIPINFSAAGDAVDYVHTGYWADKAIREAEKLRRDVAVVASSADKHFRYIPADDMIAFRAHARYLHIVTNNTVEGTQWHHPPQVAIPLIADMSSDLMSAPFDPTPFAMIYAHAQKNIGIAGVTVVAIRKSLLETIQSGLPAFFDYRTHIQHHSNYHTPPSFAIYVMWLVLQWIEEEIGGLAVLGRINQEKARLMYAYIDASPFYHCPVEFSSRSTMNIVFTLSDSSLTQQFVGEAREAGLVGLGGHRSIGGCRVSLFNGVSLEAVHALIAFMSRFERQHTIALHLQESRHP